MFKTLDTVGEALQIIGVIIPIIGVVATVLTASNPYPNLLPMAIGFCGGFTLGAMVYGFGGVVRAVVVIARNSEQNTNALNRIAQAQTGVAEALPERRIRPLK